MKEDDSEFKLERGSWVPVVVSMQPRLSLALSTLMSVYRNDLVCSNMVEAKGELLGTG